MVFTIKQMPVIIIFIFTRRIKHIFFNTKKFGTRNVRIVISMM